MSLAKRAQAARKWLFLFLQVFGKHFSAANLVNLFEPYFCGVLANPFSL
jgi:hypothetical protein